MPSLWKVKPRLTYINIDDDKIELLDAREYVGVMSEAIDEQLKAKHGADVSVLNTAPPVRRRGAACRHYER